MTTPKPTKLHPGVVNVLRIEFQIRSIVRVAGLKAPSEPLRTTIKMLRDQRRVHLWAPYKNKMVTWSVRPRCDCPRLNHQPGCFWHLGSREP